MEDQTNAVVEAAIDEAATELAAATETGRDSIRDKIERVIAETKDRMLAKLAAKGRAMSPAQLFQYEADLRVKARRAVAWEPRAKTKAPFSKVERRRKRQQANKSRRRNRR